MRGESLIGKPAPQSPRWRCTERRREAVGVSERTLWGWMAAGEIPVVRRGGTILYPVDCSANGWISRRKAARNEQRCTMAQGGKERPCRRCRQDQPVPPSPPTARAECAGGAGAKRFGRRTRRGSLPGFTGTTSAGKRIGKTRPSSRATRRQPISRLKRRFRPRLPRAGNSATSGNTPRGARASRLHGHGAIRLPRRWKQAIPTRAPGRERMEDRRSAGAAASVSRGRASHQRRYGLGG